MSDRYGKLFKPLEPPRGGLGGLRARIERDRLRRAGIRRLRYAAAAGLVLLLTGLILLGHHGRKEPSLTEFDLARMRLGMMQLPSEAITISEGERKVTAVSRVPLPTDEVVFYLVASVEAEPGPGADSQNQAQSWIKRQEM